MDDLRLNANALAIADDIETRTDELRIATTTLLGGARIIDLGIDVRGGYGARTDAETDQHPSARDGRGPRACLRSMLPPMARGEGCADHCADTRQNGPAICSRGRPGSFGRRPYRSRAIMSALARGLEMK